MTKPHNIAGVILAGGAGTRIGGAKALRPLGSGTLIDAVIARVRDQVSALALNIADADGGDYRARFGSSFPLLGDTLPPGTGPLAGVVAGLEWAASLDGVKWLATFPCDTPFLPHDLVPHLLAASTPGRPIAAEDGERLHGVCAIWPVACAPALRAGVESGRLRSMVSALEALGGMRCTIADRDAFFNVNTPEDLKRAAEIAANRG
jgi:molybdopterin-guanine dinucleotide biosynthesis protein A